MPSKAKVTLVLVFFFLFVLNTILPVLFESLAYPHKELVNIFLLVGFVLASIGSKTAESIVIGVAMVAIVSNLWDFSVYDISDFRKQVMFGSIGVLFFALLLGEIGLINLIRIFVAQTGAKAR